MTNHTLRIHFVTSSPNGGCSAMIFYGSEITSTRRIRVLYPAPMFKYKNKSIIKGADVRHV